MNDETHPITIQDAWVECPDGRLFARSWTPAAPSALAPIVLLHDSLGSVELWRSFPAALCEATGRRVVAYDRLGFGRSDPHPATLALDFIATEAEAGFAAIRRHFALDRFAVFGHSVGGGMAVNLAAHLGEACVALITESAQSFLEDRTVRGLEEARVFFQDPLQLERLGKYHGDKARWVHPELIAELSGGPVRLALMADTRHVPHREKEAEVVELVGGFLRTLP